VKGKEPGYKYLGWSSQKLRIKEKKGGRAGWSIKRNWRDVKGRKRAKDRRARQTEPHREKTMGGGKNRNPSQ